MTGKKIEKRPPTLTGDAKEDLRKLLEYQQYLYEQMNYILSLIYRSVSE